MDKSQLSEALLAWHDQNARDLPWRGERDPYRIWVSEIMLQQTRAETVKGYYAAFLREFPTVEALAAADEERVLKRWEGLGYYARARNLQRAARLVAARPDGFPRTVKEIRALPGIGEYTAGAIASIAFGLPEPAIDGNQVRALARLFGIRSCVTRPEVKRELQAVARSILPSDRPGDFNQALMGLGAMICVPAAPDCAACPVRAFCDAFARGDAGDLPVLPEKAAKRTERRSVVMVLKEGKVFARRRPENGLLGGLWEFPNFENAKTDAEIRACLREIGIEAARGKRSIEAEHVFTHLIWRMNGYFYRAVACAPELEGRFVDAAALRELPFPTALQPFRQAALEALS